MTKTRQNRYPQEPLDEGKQLKVKRQSFDAADMAAAAAQGFRDGAAKEQQAEWQPIETAPKDSSYVLLAGKYRNDVASGYWLQSAYAGNGAWIWPFVHKHPTHWMPLPAAPGPV